jgi:rRNA maturation RNase YbeY
MGFIYLEPGYRITLCWRARHRSRVRVARAMMVMTIVRGALANPRLSPLMGSVAAWRVCPVVGARKAVVRGGGCGGGLTRRFGRGASARALTWTRGGERMRGGRFAFVRASSLSSSVSSRDEGEDDDDEGYDDEDEEVGESFYVGDVECVCDVMVMDEEDDDDDVNSASPSRGSGGVDVSVLRREVEEDARAMIRLLLSASSTPGMKRMRAALPRSMSHLELSVALCSDEYIRSLNAGFRSKDSATDVLSFPAESFGPMAVLGDVVVSVDTASRQAEEVGHSLRDECRVLLVHGTLHLLGLDHELSEVDAEVMAAAEQEVLSALGWKVTGLTRRASGDADGVDVSIQRRVLVVDLDGTLLNGKSVITPRTADALRRALASGVEVVVATGKARPAAIRAAATAGLSGSGPQGCFCKA